MSGTSAAGIAAPNRGTASDEDLVAAVRAGDDAAFEELYRRYRPRVLGFVRRLAGDGARAEDLTQDAFLAALRRMRQTDAPIAFKAWIFEIARNASIDLFRRGTRAREVSIETQAELGGGPGPMLAGTREPDAMALDRERLGHLREALDELSPPHLRIIVLRELEGLSYREIGHRMELTPAAVESTLFRARRKLEHEYAQLDTGRRCRSMGAVVARLAEGVEDDRGRRRLHRHARRCPYCRLRARRLGVEPMLAHRSPGSRAAALLPLPWLGRRRTAAEAGVARAAGEAAPLGILFGQPLDAVGGAAAAKAAAALAAALLVGGGATLGGTGPLALDRGQGLERGGDGGAERARERSLPRPGAGRDADVRTGGTTAPPPGTAPGSRGEPPSPLSRAQVPSVSELPPVVDLGPALNAAPRAVGAEREPVQPLLPGAPALVPEDALPAAEPPPPPATGATPRAVLSTAGEAPPS